MRWCEEGREHLPRQLVDPAPPVRAGRCHSRRVFPVAVIQSAMGGDVESVSLVWRVDGASRDNDRPCGVAVVCQVSEHSVEPVPANRCRNLLSHE